MSKTYGELVRWAMDRGVELCGIEPRTIRGIGTGIFATREIETLLIVPTQAIRTLDNVPQAIQDSLPQDISVHCLLATYLSLENTNEFAVWSAVVPTLASFKTSTPLLWPPELQTLLPNPAKELLTKQQMNFQRDWSAVSKAFPSVSQEQYLHAWLLVNTRSFYYTTSKLERFPNDDRLALLPVADLFNHADVGCEPTFSTQSYTFTADRAYRVDEEIHTCYGAHSNDFLLTEYGFLLTENRWDAVCLDDVVLPSLNKEQKNLLERSGYLGEYMLDLGAIACFRTQVALRMLGCAQDQWRRFADGEVGDEASQHEVKLLLMHFLDRFIKMIQQTLENIRNLNVGQASQRKLLELRWKEIENMIKQSITCRDG